VESAKDLALWLFATISDIVSLLLKGNRTTSQLQPLKEALQHVIDNQPFIIREFNFKEMLSLGDKESIRTAWQTLYYKIGISIEVPEPGYGFDISYRTEGARTLAYLPPQTPENIAAMQQYISGENIEWPEVSIRNYGFRKSQALNVGDWYFFGLTRTNKGLVEADIKTTLTALSPVFPVGLGEFLVHLIVDKELERLRMQRGEIIYLPGIVYLEDCGKPLILKRVSDGRIIPITIDEVRDDDCITILTRWSLETYAHS
jgi:hypothetical protein